MQIKGSTYAIFGTHQGLWTSLGEGSLWCAQWKEGRCFGTSLPQMIAFPAFYAPSPGSFDHILLLIVKDLEAKYDRMIQEMEYKMPSICVSL
jgi:hypothetical protein